MTIQQQQSQNRLYQRIIGRIRLVLTLVFLLTAGFAVFVTLSNGLNTVETARQTGLLAVDNAIETEVSDAVNEMVALASSGFAREYNTLANEVIISGSSLSAFQETQRGLLRAFNDFMERHPDRFTAVRFLTRENQVWGEATNEFGNVTLTPEIQFRDDSAITPIYNRIVEENLLSGVYFSDIQTDGDGTPLATAYIPISGTGGLELQGILEFRMRIPSFMTVAEGIREDAIYDVPGRQLVIVDDSGFNLYNTNPELGLLDAGVIDTVIDTEDELRGYFSGGNLYSTRSIASYNGLGMPWYTIIKDTVGVAIQDAVVLSGVVVMLLAGIWITIYFVISRLLKAGLAPLSDLRSGISAEGITSPVRIETDDEVSEIMLAVDEASRKIEALTKQLEAETYRRNRDIEIAALIGRETATLSQIDVLLTRAINLITQELNFYHAQVFLVDDARVNAVLVHSHGEAGQKMLEMGHKLAVGSNTVIGRVTGEGVPVIVNDTQEGGQPHGFNALLPDTRAEMGLPLVIGDEIIGALDIQSVEPNAFREEDLSTFELLADQLAVAINKARLLNQSSERIEQIERMNRQFTRSAWENFDTEANLAPAYRYNLIDIDANPQEPVIPHGAVDIPISIRGEVIGTLSAASGENYELSEGDQMILRAISDRIALAIENARLFQQTQNTLNETSALYQLNRFLNEASTLDDILQAVIISVMPDASGGQVWVFDDYASSRSPAWMEIRGDLAIAERNEASANLVGTRLHMPDHSFLRKLVNNQVTLINDAEMDSRLDSGLQILFRRIRARALVIIPLNVRGSWIGLLMVEFEEAREFNEREGRLYAALIDQAGIAIDNRLLLEQTEAALARNENLYAASRIINTAQEFTDLVYAAVATSNDNNLYFALALLEGELDETAWPTRNRLVAISEGGNVDERNDVYSFVVPSDSPLRNREPEIISESTPSSLEKGSEVGWLEWRDGLSFAALFPLFSANQPLAIFAVMSDHPYTMTLELNEVYRALTGQMSTQIENRRLLQRTADTLDETRRLYNASRAIASAQDSNAVYYTATEHLAQPLLQLTVEEPQVFHFYILISQPEPIKTAPELACVSMWTNDPDQEPKIKHGDVIDNHEQPFANLLKARDGQFRVPDVHNPAFDGGESGLTFLRNDGATSAMIVPILVREQWFGFVVFHSSKPNAFGEQYERFADALIGQVALSLENQKLFREAQFEARRAQLEARRAFALAEAAQLANQIGGGFGEDEGDLNDVLQQVAQATGFDRWSLALIDDRSKRLETIVHYVPDAKEPNGIYPTYKLGEQHPMTHVVKTDALLIVNDVADNSVLQTMPEGQDFARDFGKFVIAPVRLGGRTVGALLTGRPEAVDDLDEGDGRLVATLAAQIAVAIENRRLFQQVQSEQQTLSSTLSTLPAGVLVLDPVTLKPIITNEQARYFLGAFIDQDLPFNAENYHLYRTGTQLYYPDDELPVFVARESGESAATEDVAVITQDDHIDLLVNAAPIIGQDGKMSAIVATFSDISNLRSLENTLQENLRETVAVYEAQRQLSESEGLDDVYDALVVQLAMLQPTDGFLILLDEKTRMLSTARNLIADLADPNTLFDLLDYNRFTYIEDVADVAVDEHVKDYLTSLNIQSLMSVPLRVSDRETPVGWMVLVHDEPDAFSQEQERIMTQLGDVASTAIENRLLILRTQSALRETDKLYSAGTVISRARDREQLASALETSLESLNADTYSAFLVGSGYFEHAIAEHGEMADMLRAALSRHEIPEDGLFIEDLLALDIQDTMVRDLQAGMDDVRSIGVVNLRVKDMNAGRLAIAYRTQHDFTDSDKRFMRSLSDNVSVVLDNLALVDEIQSTLEETTVLYQAVRSLSNAMTPQDILDTIVDHIIQPHVNQAFIMMLEGRDWDHPSATVEIAVHWSTDESLDIQGLKLTSDQFPGWSKLKTNTVLAIDDLETNDQLDALEMMGFGSLGARSVALIPLRVANRDIGVAWISSDQPYTHSDREIRVFQSFGEQASLSLEAAYLLQQTERRARQLETSAEVSNTVGKILDLDELLPQLVDLIRSAFSYDHVQIFMMDEKRQWAELRASTGEAGKQLLEIKHRLEKGSSSVIGQVTATGEPSIALDTATADVIHRPNPYLPDTRSEMALPLIIKGEVIGALDVQSNQPNAFSEEDIAVLKTLAAQIAVAIDNANLYQEAQDQADRMSLLFEITTAAAVANSLDEALVTVADHLQSSQDALSVAVYLTRSYLDANEDMHIALNAVALAGVQQPITEIEAVPLEDSTSVLATVGNQMQPHVVVDTQEESNYLPIAASARSAVIVPMISGVDLLGVIVMESAYPNRYDIDEIQLIQTLAGSLSAIIQSTQLLERLQAANEELRELDRIKSDFLANMSHELRTPLNSIIGFSRVMLKGIDGPLTEMQEQDLTTIYTSGNHLLNLINDILDQAKIAAGKMDIKFDYFDIKAVVDVVKSIAIGYMKDKTIDLHVEVAKNLPKAYGDEFRLRQVVINLMSNAIKFTSEGAVTLRAYPIEHPETGKTFVRVDVIDTGIGIAEADLPLLFEAFRQVDSSLTRTAGGTGLGLPIAKSLIEMMGGEMIVTSEVNAGSTFSVTVPIEPTVEVEKESEEFEDQAEAKVTEEETSVPAKSDTQQVRKTLETRAVSADGPSQRVMQAKRQILLIEDNPDMVDQFRRALQPEGFEVLAASIPLEAEAMASGLHPTLIVMDVNFAKGQGWDILQRLKDRDDTFDIPIIVVSLSEESERVYQLGAHTFIQRPFMPEDLVEAALKAEKESNTERILIIDDQPEAIRLLKNLLDEHGHYRVFTAENGVEGISLIARRRPDLVILDLRMPDMDGFAVLNELRSNPETAKIPVMIVTGDVDFNADEKEQLGSIRILHKTDISQEEYDSFLDYVQKHLSGDHRR